MTYTQLLESRASFIVADAAEELDRKRPRHPKGDDSLERMRAMYEVALGCIRERTVTPMSRHVHRVAESRFGTGYHLSEVQEAINILEQEIWRSMQQGLTPPEFARGIGLVSTVLGAAKDVLANTYLSLARGMRTTMLDLTAASQGTDYCDGDLLSGVGSDSC